MVKTKASSREPKQSKLNRSNLRIAAVALGLVILVAAGWFISREIGGGPRAHLLSAAAPLLAELTQSIEVAIGQTQIARQQIQLAADNQNLVVIQLDLHRFLNVLVGGRAGDFDAQAGNPGDGKGVLRHLEEMLALLRDARVQQATAALGASMESKRQQVSTALENARQDALASQLHAQGALKSKTLEASQEDIRKAIGWLDSAISDTAESNDPQAQTLYFAQARLREIAQAMK